MARSSKKQKAAAAEEDEDEEVRHRRRLKSLAFTNKIVSEVPARPHAPLAPSNAVVKQHGKDIVKKSQRKNRFLFSFPGLLAPTGNGKIGDLKDLGSKNPILYLDFPQGRMKLFGTIVFPKNKYLTLQFPRGGKSVMCEDYFDNMIVFSDAWWIGTKDDNPDEAQLDFPDQLTPLEGRHADDYDFRGGAGGGVASTSASVVNSKQADKKSESTSPDADLDDHLSDDGLIQVTPVRQSARTAGKRFNFGEASSGDEDGSVERNTDSSEGEDDKVGRLDSSSRKHDSGKIGNLSFGDLKTDSEGGAQIPEQNQESSVLEAKSKKQSFTANASKDDSHSTRGSLVQATISTMFKKVEKKVASSSQAPKTPKSPGKSASLKVAVQMSLQAPSKRKPKQDGGPRKKAKNAKENDAVGKSLSKNKEPEVEDDIEEVASSSQDTDDDEDWAD